MMSSYLSRVTFVALALVLAVLFIDLAQGTVGTLTCTNGKWKPDAKLIGFGLKCPLPLDGKAKSKGKTTMCALKKLKLYDGTTVQVDKIPAELCNCFKPEAITKACFSTMAACVKDSTNFFKDKKQDPEYKTWSEPYSCLEKWIGGACKK